MSKRKLTPQQRKFANEFIKTNNAYQSAIKAGYARGTARNATKQLLENTGIQQFIHKKTGKAEAETEITIDMVIANLLKTASGMSSKHRLTTYDHLKKELTSDRTYTGPPKVKDQVAAAQLVLQMAGKLKADDGELTNAKIRKANAEAKIAEAKLADLEDDKDDQMDALTDMLGKLAKNVPKDDQNDD